MRLIANWTKIILAPRSVYIWLWAFSKRCGILRRIFRYLLRNAIFWHSIISSQSILPRQIIRNKLKAVHFYQITIFIISTSCKRWHFPGSGMPLFKKQLSISKMWLRCFGHKAMQRTMRGFASISNAYCVFGRWLFCSF